MTFFTEIKKSNLKFIWKHKRPQIAKSIVSKKSNARGIRIPDFKLHFRVIVTKTARFLTQEQWNRMEDPEIRLHRYNNLIFYNSTKIQCWKKIAS
jgi:hypothetical protein